MLDDTKNTAGFEGLKESLKSGALGALFHPVVDIAKGHNQID